MAEEFVELGFEGLDKFADRYWDRTYDRLPNIPRPGRRRRQAPSRQLPSGSSPQHPDKGYEPPRSPLETAYSQSPEPEMYGPSGRGGYARDQRYYEAEPVDHVHRAPGPGFRVPRELPEYGGGRSTEPYVQSGQRGYGRPAPQRRGSSWSPPRPEQRGRSPPSRRARSRSQPRSRSRASEVKHLLIATIGGALAGGFAGNQVGKKSHLDTAATVAGAVIGGVGAREAADHWDKARHKKKQQRGERSKGEHGNGEGRRSEQWHGGGR